MRTSWGGQVVELGAGDVKDRLAGQPRSARAVHQDVDATEFVYARLDQCVGYGWIGRLACVAHTRNTLRRSLYSVRVTTVDHDAGAFCSKQSATANPMPRDPPTTTAALPASGSLIGFARLRDGLHHVHVPEAAHVGQQAGVVDLVREYAADRA